MFEPHDLLRASLAAALASPTRNYRFLPARLPPDAGAALHAAKLNGAPLGPASIAALEAGLRKS
jgi:hypothetical protein